NDTNGLFTVAAQPTIDAIGKLSFTPAPNARGTAQVTVKLQYADSTAAGGFSLTPPQALAIDVAKLHPWHNTLHGLDVTGPSGQPDSAVVPADVVAII